jgi:thioredoxin-related protein
LGPSELVRSSKKIFSGSSFCEKLEKDIFDPSQLVRSFKKVFSAF